jgi:hypothetical protein
MKDDKLKRDLLDEFRRIFAEHGVEWSADLDRSARDSVNILAEYRTAKLAGQVS